MNYESVEKVASVYDMALEKMAKDDEGFDKGDLRAALGGALGGAIRLPGSGVAGSALGAVKGRRLGAATGGALGGAAGIAAGIPAGLFVPGSGGHRTARVLGTALGAGIGSHLSKKKDDDKD